MLKLYGGSQVCCRNRVAINAVGHATLSSQKPHKAYNPETL